MPAKATDTRPSLHNSKLICKYMANILNNNKNLLLEILSRGKKAFVYYEYDAIYDAINNITQEELVRKK